MTKEIGSYEAKTKLPEILRRVEAGEAFTITKRGRPIADLLPSRSTRRMQTESAITNMMNAKKRKMSDSLIKELKESGRK